MLRTAYAQVLLLAILLLALPSLQSCKEEGCTDDKAINYNGNARLDDGSCDYEYGCTDPTAINYDRAAGIDDGTCEYEFIADGTSFSDFLTWDLGATHADYDTVFGSAHGINDSSVIRDVYFLDGQTPINSSYPIGTRVVKYSYNLDNTFLQITGMAKRGNDFDTTNNNWEWFLLNADGTIALDTAGNEMRGAYLFNYTNCGSCHQSAATDFVFSK